MMFGAQHDRNKDADTRAVSHESAPLNEERCEFCGHLLFKARAQGSIEIKCKCKHIVRRRLINSS
jgi:hypothetical protein